MRSPATSLTPAAPGLGGPLRGRLCRPRPPLGSPCPRARCKGTPCAARPSPTAPPVPVGGDDQDTVTGVVRLLDVEPVVRAEPPEPVPETLCDGHLPGRRVIERANIPVKYELTSSAHASITPAKSRAFAPSNCLTTTSTFACDIAYSERPTASRASSSVAYSCTSMRRPSGAKRKAAA